MPAHHTALDRGTFGIGVLGLTACVLFVGFMLLSAQPPAYGIGMNDRGGDYIMLTQQMSNSSEGLVIIDAAAQHMIVYQFDYNTKQLEIASQVRLADLPKPRDWEEEEPQPGRRRQQ